MRRRELLNQYVKPHLWRVSLLGLLLLVATGLQLTSPRLLRSWVDAPNRADAWLFVALGVGAQLATLGAAWLSEDVGWRATNRLRVDLMLHCLRLDMPFHNARTPGEMIERIDGDVTTLANFCSGFVVRVLGGVVLIAGVLVTIFLEDWRLGAIYLGITAVALAVLYRLRRVSIERHRAARQAIGELFGFVEERLAGTEDLRASGATGHVLWRLHGYMSAIFARWRPIAIADGLLLNATFVLWGIASAVALAFCAHLYLDGAMSIGTVYMLTFYGGLLLAPVRNIADQVQDLQRASAGVARVGELFATEPTVVDGLGASLGEGAPALELDGVSFGYRPEQVVLDDVSFHLAPGQVLGVLGRTGSGKSTIARLLFRLYDPGDGAVRLGDEDVRALRLGDLRARVGLVTQDVQLFRATVRENVTLFDDAIPEERTLAVLEQLGLGPWLRGLPNGLDTVLQGTGGLSAGEAQLLAFARVFLRDPGLVILDEASSRLDPETERLVERATDRLLEGRTAIVIAHRLGTVERADRILVMEEGRVVEEGPRAALAADPSSRFAALLTTQVGQGGARGGTPRTCGPQPALPAANTANPVLP
jgi:ATP-binding cassette subfamily B protein